MDTALTDRAVPYSLEAEAAVIGSLFLDRDAILKLPYLQPAHFYQTALGTIYGAIGDMAARGVPADLVTVGWELQRRGLLDRVGGLSFLFHVIAATPTAVHVEYYARIIEEAARLRGAITGGGQIAGLAYDSSRPVGDTMDAIRALADSITTAPDMHGLRSLRAIGEAVLDSVLLAQDTGGGLTGVPSGLGALDVLTGGFQPGDVYILAARPRIGKTALATQIASYAAGLALHVGFFSLEMSNKQLFQRLLAQTTPCDLHRLITGHSDMPRARLLEAFGRLSELPLFIDDAAVQTVAEAVSHARQRHVTDRLDLLILDYLQLFEGAGTAGKKAGTNRQEDVAQVSRALKHLARDLNVPVLALAQLNRAAEGGNGPPLLSQLRESGAIEQDASVVMFLHREQEDRPERVTLTVAKNRNGPEGAFPLRFDAPTTRFFEEETRREVQY